LINYICFRILERATEVPLLFGYTVDIVEVASLGIHKNGD